MTLHEYLTVNKLNASAFAVKVGSPPSTITRILRGERHPGIKLMARIASATEGAVTPNDFLPAASPPTAAATAPAS